MGIVGDKSGDLFIKKGRHPRSENMPWQTWTESVSQLANAMLL